MSTPPSPTMWQELQLMVCNSESLGSKYSILPSSTRSAVASTPGTAGGASGIGSKVDLAFSRRLS